MPLRAVCSDMNVIKEREHYIRAVDRAGSCILLYYEKGAPTTFFGQGADRKSRVPICFLKKWPPRQRTTFYLTHFYIYIESVVTPTASNRPNMDYQSPYSLHGEVHPFMQKNTKNRKQVAKSGGSGNPWDQLPAESTTAYSAFLLYLDMGAHNRSQSKLAKVIYGNDKSTGQISKWSVDYDWINRAEAWDRYCVEMRQEKMESGIKEAEDIMLSYLPKVALNLAKAAAGEDSIGRSEMRAVSDFLDRVGPAKQRRSQPATINNNLTINAPSLPAQVKEDTDNIPDAEIIEEEAQNLIPQNLRDKRGS